MPFTIDKTSYRSPNLTRNKITRKPITIVPRGIMLHSDEGTFRSSVAGWPPTKGWLLDPRSGVSCAYYITREGRIYELADPRHRSWHGGPGDAVGVDDLNLFIGIELEHKQGQDWPTVQLDACIWLCRQLIREFKLPEHRIIAHRWANRPTRAGRKYDPTDLSDVAIHQLIDAMYLADGVDLDQVVIGIGDSDYEAEVLAWLQEQKAPLSVEEALRCLDLMTGLGVSAPFVFALWAQLQGLPLGQHGLFKQTLNPLQLRTVAGDWRAHITHADGQHFLCYESPQLGLLDAIVHLKNDDGASGRTTLRQVAPRYLGLPDALVLEQIARRMDEIAGGAA